MRAGEGKTAFIRCTKKITDRLMITEIQDGIRTALEAGLDKSEIMQVFEEMVNAEILGMLESGDFFLQHTSQRSGLPPYAEVK